MNEAAALDAPWWEATPDGAEIPAALLRVERPPHEGDEPDSAELRRQARFAAGVEYVASSLGAAQPVTWDGGGATLVIGGGDAESLPERAFFAAKELWERARIDLDLPVRVGVHVASIRFRGDPASIEGDAIMLARQLAGVAPRASVAMSEDVALALRDADRADLARGPGLLGGEPVWIFPSGAAPRREASSITEDEALADALRRYALGRDVRDLRYVGFRLVKKEPPVLDILDVFVPLEVERLPGREANKDRPRGRLRAHGTDHPEEPAGPMALRELLTKHRSVIFLGDPGSGKTTLIRWLAVMAARGRFVLGSETGIFERLVPLPVSVGRLAELRRDGASVPLALARYFHDRGLGDEPTLASSLACGLEAGRCLVLLDGLDEVRADERQAIHDWLAAFAVEYPRNRFVATSRHVGYVGFALPGVVEATVRPFDDAQVERYVRAFTTAYARWELGGDDAGRGEAEAEGLLVSLRTNERLQALARNPFMLSSLALVHRAEGRLPRHRVQAYAIFARALCETWAEARRLVAGGPAGETIAYEEEALPILGELALAMHRRYPAGVAPEAFVVDMLAKALGERQDISGEESQKAARAFLERAGHRVQILLERGAGEWGFLHLTFQEFFTAAGLHALERFEEEAFAHLFDPRWEEVLRLGVGYLALEQKRPEAARRFVQKVLEYEAPEPNRWVTSVLKKQVPLAALLAAEAGDTLPEGLKRRVAEAMAAWVCDAPSDERMRECLEDLASYDFGNAIEAALATRVRDEDPRARKAAAAALGWVGVYDEAECLVAALYDEDRGVRDAAATSLWRAGPANVREILGNAALHSRPEVRAGAVDALLHLVSGDERIDVLRAGLADADAEVRCRALVALEDVFVFRERRATPDVGRLVFQYVGDESAPVRRAATGFLFYFPSIFDEVSDRLTLIAETDPDLEVRGNAVGVVAKVASGRVVNALFALLLDPKVNPETIDDFVDRLAEHPLQDLVEQTLFRLLAEASPRERARAVELLARRVGDAGSRQLVSFVNDPDHEVRESAALGLVDLIESGDLLASHEEYEQVLDALKRLADDDDPDVRATAIMGLAADVHGGAVERVVLATSDPSVAVRTAALYILTTAGIMWRSVAPVAYRAIDDSEHEVRESAIRYLQYRVFDDPVVVDHLLRVFPTTPTARYVLWNIAERLHAPKPPAAS